MHMQTVRFKPLYLHTCCRDATLTTIVNQKLCYLHPPCSLPRTTNPKNLSAEAALGVELAVERSTELRAYEQKATSLADFPTQAPKLLVKSA